MSGLNIHKMSAKFNTKYNILDVVMYKNSHVPGYMYSLAWPCGLECQWHHFSQVLPYWPDTKSGQIHENVYRTHFTVQSIRATSWR